MFWLHRLSLGFLLLHLASAHVGTSAELLTLSETEAMCKAEEEIKEHHVDVCFEGMLGWARFCLMETLNITG